MGLLPGSAAKAVKNHTGQWLRFCYISSRHGWELTSVNVLADEAREGALVRLLDGLRLKLGAEDVAAGVHGALEGVAAPAEHVVAVLAIPSAAKTVRICLLYRQVPGDSYTSPMLNTNGCVPSSGQSARLLNRRVSHMISIKSWGSFTG